MTRLPCRRSFTLRRPGLPNPAGTRWPPRPLGGRSPLFAPACPLFAKEGAGAAVHAHVYAALEPRQQVPCGSCDDGGMLLVDEGGEFSARVPSHPRQRHTDEAL